MSDQERQERREERQQDREQRQGVIGAVTDLSSKLVATLPPAFLGLCLINLIFVIALVYYFDHLRADRVVLFNRLLDACLQMSKGGN